MICEKFIVKILQDQVYCVLLRKKEKHENVLKLKLKDQT